MSFIRTTRLFNNKITLDFWLAYFLNVLAVLFLAVVFVGVPDLRQFSSGLERLRCQPIAIGMIGALGLYGTRISMYIAIIRQNRAPQVAEWWCTLIGLGLAVVCLFFSGYLLQAFGSLHGYRLCHIGHDRVAVYDFARFGSACLKTS